jgi:hypothetical protein
MSRSSRSHRLGAATLTAVLATALLLLGGCGGAGTDSTAPSTVGSSTSAPASDLKTLSAGDFYKAVTRAQKDAGSYHFKLSEDGAGSLTGQGDADTSGAQPASRSTITSPAGKVESIAKDGLIYVKAPGLGTKKQWLKIDPTDKSGIGALAGKLGGNADPGKLLAALRQPRKFKATGEQDVHGVPTIHYVISVDSGKVFAALGFPKKLAASAKLPKTFDYQMWVDADHRPIRVVQTLDINKQKTTTNITFSKYGEPVTIKAPPANETSTKLPPTATM